MKKPNLEIWELTFARAPGGEAPMGIRIRRLLKIALRACGLRCIKVSGPELDTGQAGDVDAEGRQDAQD